MEEIAGQFLCLIFELLAGPICGALFPNGVTRFGLVAWWLFSFATMWLVIDWWGADPASDLRTYLVSLCCVGMPGLGLYRALLPWSTPPAPPSLPRAKAGWGRLRNDRLRVS
jgi:hypothetical protein